MVDPERKHALLSLDGIAVAFAQLAPLSRPGLVLPVNRTGSRFRQDSIHKAVVPIPVNSMTFDRHRRFFRKGLLDRGENTALVFGRKIFYSRAECAKEITEKEVTLIGTEFQYLRILLVP